VELVPVRAGAGDRSRRDPEIRRGAGQFALLLQLGLAAGQSQLLSAQPELLVAQPQHADAGEDRDDECSGCHTRTIDSVADVRERRGACTDSLANCETVAVRWSFLSRVTNPIGRWFRREPEYDLTRLRRRDDDANARSAVPPGDSVDLLARTVCEIYLASETDLLRSHLARLREPSEEWAEGVLSALRHLEDNGTRTTFPTVRIHTLPRTDLRALEGFYARLPNWCESAQGYLEITAPGLAFFVLTFRTGPELSGRFIDLLNHQHQSQAARNNYGGFTLYPNRPGRVSSFRRQANPRGRRAPLVRSRSRARTRRPRDLRTSRPADRDRAAMLRSRLNLYSGGDPAGSIYAGSGRVARIGRLAQQRAYTVQTAAQFLDVALLRFDRIGQGRYRLHEIGSELIDVARASVPSASAPAV
jgi:hypothetical protein